MKIQLKEITIRELTKGYKDNEEDGVIGYGGKLDIRPPYQRQFIYKPKQRDAVIDTVNKEFPLNVMYFAVREDGNFEIIDGQQRTISICQYAQGDFSFKDRFFVNLQDDEQKKFLDYKLMVYFCSGKDSEKLQWFETINIAGERLTDQELKNAVYSGSWVTDAKRHFSKNNCAAYNIGSSYLLVSPIRQDYLETAIKWISKGDIKGYMGKHQHDPNSDELWSYFQDVINWIKVLFPEPPKPRKPRKEMKGVDWGDLYNNLKNKKFDAKKLEKQVSELMMDDDVTKKSGIYPYVLTGKESFLNIRSFTPQQKRESYERQKGKCVVSKKQFDIDEMEADHITPWHEGGKTHADNCQMLCREDNRRKSGK